MSEPVDHPGEGVVTSPGPSDASGGRPRGRRVGGWTERLRSWLGGDTAGTPHVARAELVLARDDSVPLRALPLRPDPLAGFAGAMEHVGADEHASVVVDLLPLSPGQRARHRRRLQQTAAGATTGRLGRLVDEARVGAGHPPRRQRQPRAARGGDGDADRREQRAVAAKAGDPHVLWGLQVLLRTSSPDRGRARAHLQALMAGFEAWAGRNWLRVRGRTLGVAFAGADAPWHRGHFDRRFDSGEFDPPKLALVTTGEIAGWLKPPTRHCASAGVARSGGVVPSAPRGLPDWHADRPEVLPLGRVAGRDGSQQLVGAPLAETYFTYMAGRSRWGKTETLINQFIHLARSGHGCFFLDPHEDAIARIKPYLTDVADRVVEINLAPRGIDAHQAGWNLFAMRGRSDEDVEAVVSAVVDSFASALRWGEVNNRALTLTTMGAKSLAELALQLPAELAPTLFQLSTLLSDEAWRETVLPHLSADCQQFWRSRFPKLAADAITPVTNLIDRLASSHAVKGLLGSSVSSYDIRACMDAGRVVLACPAGTGDKDRLIANFLVYDLLQAALSRKDTPPARRRPFYAFFDEVQTYDGASRGNLAALLEQAAKYGLRAFLANQNPERLTPATYDAVTTNRSHLAATAVNARAAGMLAKEYGGQVDAATIAGLPKYQYTTSITLAGEITAPFLVRGAPVDELFAHAADTDGVAELDRAIDRNTGRRPIRDVAGELALLDQRILDHLHTPDAGPSTAGRRGRASGVVDDALVYDPTDEQGAT